MRTFLLRTGFLFMIGHGIIIVFFAKGAEANRMITADVRQSYVFGQAAEVTVRYRNDGADNWSLQTPDDSPDVMVYYATSEQMGNPNGYRLGKKGVVFLEAPDGSVTTTYFIRDLPNILIKPGEQHVLTTDICEAWTGAMVPETWFLWVEDVREELISETVQFQMLFTGESVDILLGIAKDIGERRSKRRWHAEWLRKFRPDMRLVWPRDDDPPEVKTRKEAVIQNRLEGFETFWSKEKDSPTVERILKEINGETKRR